MKMRDGLIADYCCRGSCFLVERPGHYWTGPGADCPARPGLQATGTRAGTRVASWVLKANFGAQEFATLESASTCSRGDLRHQSNVYRAADRPGLRHAVDPARR